MKYEDWERYENERLAKSGGKQRRIFTIDGLAEKVEKLEEEVAALKDQLGATNGEVQVLEAWNEKTEWLELDPAAQAGNLQTRDL
jgi:hypothetical protein